MTNLEDRRRAFEAKWAHDEEARFLVMARRNRLVGYWAAEKKGLSGQDAEAFAISVIKSDFEEKGDEDVFRKLRIELGGAIPDTVIREKMQAFLEVAERQEI